MTNIKFLLFFSLILIILSVKAVFFFQESAYGDSWFGRTDIIMFVTLFVVGTASYIKDTLSDRSPTHPSVSPHKLTFFLKCALLGLIGTCLTLSFVITLSKKSLDWDDVALYDARAKFLAQGYKFSEMEDLSKYDIKNSYYYLLYPPFTSELHFLWRGLQTGIEISVLYSVMLTLLAVGIFVTTKSHIGTVEALAVSFLVLAQEHVFLTSVLAYTNLPYTLYLSLGILLLYDYLESRRTWEFIFGILLVALSQWIRFLEPTWLAVVLAFGVTSFRHFSLKKSLFMTVAFGALCAFEYKNWQFFVSSSSNQEPIFQTSGLAAIEPVVGVFTGSLIAMFMFFCKAWGIPLLIHVSALVTKTSDNQPWHLSKDLFLKLTILLSIGMYFAGLYFISFQVEWWPEMGGSLVRSSTFLFPVSIYLLVKEFKNHF